ncbi:MAG: hypothetical protein Q8O57_03795, partial [Kiritimatiellota bacterium]|nr:hypothetical protein [Kiritimatiellota bacterium]
MTLPLETQYAVSAALGKDQTAYHISPMTQADPASPKGLRRAVPAGECAGYQAANPNQHFDARFDAQGASVVSGGTPHWDLSVREWGYGDAGLDRVEDFSCPASLLCQGSAGQAGIRCPSFFFSGPSSVVCRPSSAVRPFVSANRVEYRRGALTEWYVNGPLGLQQGFTVTAPPARRSPGGAPLTLVLNLPAGGGHSQVDADRKGLTLLTDKGEPSLRYSGLTALDADGRRLPAWLETRCHELLLRVDDTG